MNIVDELKGIANLSLSTTSYNDRDEALNKLAVYRAAVRVEMLEKALLDIADQCVQDIPHPIRTYIALTTARAALEKK